MAIGGFLARGALTALALAGGALFGGTADAATVYNYSFVQTGYNINPVYAYAPSPGTLSGTFSGSVAPSGYLDPASLTNYHLTFTYDGAPVSYLDAGAPAAFSYHPGDNGSLSIVQAFGNGFVGCVGFVVGYQCGGGNALGSLSVNLAAIPFEVSSTAPIVTLVSTTLDPPISSTPVPATLPLFASALAGLGLVARAAAGSQSEACIGRCPACIEATGLKPPKRGVASGKSRRIKPCPKGMDRRTTLASPNFRSRWNGNRRFSGQERLGRAGACGWRPACGQCRRGDGLQFQLRADRL
jgi:hypothetical protein